MLRQRHIGRNVAFQRVVFFLVRRVLSLLVADVVVLPVSDVFFPVEIVAVGIRSRFFLILSITKRLLVIPTGVFVRNFCSAVLQYRIYQKLFFHVSVQLLRIELEDLDRLDQFRRHHQFLRLFNC